MNLENFDKLTEIVPEYFGEALQLYPWIKTTECTNDVWRNRTTIENATWLIKKLNGMNCLIILDDVTEETTEKQRQKSLLWFVKSFTPSSFHLKYLEKIIKFRIHEDKLKNK